MLTLALHQLRAALAQLGDLDPDSLVEATMIASDVLVVEVTGCAADPGPADDIEVVTVRAPLHPDQPVEVQRRPYDSR